jgi:hypothetical protein
MREAMDLMMEAAVVFSSLNVVILTGLLYLYARITWRSRALYPIGLLLFATLLLLQNLVTAYSYLAMTPFFGESLLPYLLGISVLEFGGLLALTKVTL